MNTYRKTIFSNGLGLITVPMPQVETVTVLILVGAGSRYEEKQTNGLSHFLEHMAFKGTKKRPSALHISSEIDSIGGEFNAFTSKDHTGFYIKARSSHLELLVEVLSDMLLNSLFRKEEIEREKGVIIEEINMYEDTPIRKVGEVYEELLYGRHPLGWHIAGTHKSVRAVTRDDFINYVDKVYAPNNTVVVVAGGVGANVLSLIKKYLSGWKKRSVGTFKKFTKDVNKGSKPAVLLASKDTEQAHLVIGARSYPQGHPKRYSETLLAAILGGGMSSRLFIEVRERRGLAYYVRSDTTRYVDVGNFATQAGVDTKRIDDAITVILDQFRRIASEKKGIGEKELKKAKEYIKGKLVLGLEDSRSVAAFYGTQELLERKIKTPSELMKKIDAVSVGDIAGVAGELFVDSKLNLAVIGPFKDSQKFQRLLRI